MSYVDVHTHLTHDFFKNDYKEVIESAVDAKVGAIVVNGLEPKSNRQVLQMSRDFPVVKAALGIYPSDAVCHLLPQDFPYKVDVFDVDDEISFIKERAKQGDLSAIGECGLDGYVLDESTFEEQEKVFEKFINISLETNIPLIIHTRKREKRTAEILKFHGVKKVNFHCYSSKVKQAIRWAEEEGWYFSIPANAGVNEGFAKMLESLPSELILTETDAPYLAPQRGERNEPKNVVGTIDILAKLRGWSHDRARDQVWENYTRLFGSF